MVSTWSDPSRGAVTEYTRQEQAQAILQRNGRRMASRLLGRAAVTGADFDAAFTLERIDLVAEIRNPGDFAAFGRQRVGPRDGLYILPQPDGFRVYVQERGVPQRERAGLDFDEAREAVIDHLIVLNGIPWKP